MADVEMDLDPSRVFGHDAQGDEDLITYDIDTDAMAHNDPASSAHDMEIHESMGNPPVSSDMDTHTTVHMETQLDHLGTEPSDAMDTLESSAFAGVARSDADMLSDVGAEDFVVETEEEPANKSNETPEEPMTTSFAEDQEPDAPEILIGDAHANDAPHTEEPVAEVDYQFDPEKPSTDPAVQLNGAFGSLQDDDKANKLHDENDTAAPEDGDVPVPVPAAVASDANEDGFNEELTWEEERQDEDKNDGEGVGEGVPAVSENDDATVDPETTDLASPEETLEASGVAQTVDPEPAAVVAVDGTDDTTEAPLTEVHEDGTEQHEQDQQELDPEVETEKVVATAPKDNQATHEDKDEQHHYPSITVQYKGEEFPCFAASDGFFTDESFVKESMEQLLAGFRAELGAELTSDEELIFHIDELGLEFAESSQRDLLVGTTLQHIMEIFDILVQNQDHDTSPRTLYTYLFTRTSTSKRLEFLTESASSGRGLDEVIHLFEPVMTHGADNQTGFHGEGDEDLSSPGEDSFENDVQNPTDAQGANAGEAAETEEHWSEPEPEKGDSDVVQEDITYDVNEINEKEETENQGLAEADTAGADPAEADPTAAGSGSASVDVAAVPTQQAESDKSTAPEPTEADEPLTAADDLEQNNDDDAESVDFGQDPADEVPSGTRGPEATTTVTSASTTLDGNEAPASQSLDDGEGEEVEIDWRDDEENDEEVVAGDQTAAAKRARADDEPGIDGEYEDAKRQRSS